MSKARIAEKHERERLAIRMAEEQARKRKKNYITTAIVCVALVVAIVIGVTVYDYLNKAPRYKAVIDVKDYGTITLTLDTTYAPITVENFVKLAKSGFYDGLTFHRIMKGFMIQGGDPKHDGTGGSDKEIKGEYANNGVENNLSHKRGVISMARESDDYNSASSQFFICDADSTFLDGDYAAFGWVTSGMDVVDKIAADAKPSDGNGTIPYASQPVINKITVTPME